MIFDEVWQTYPTNCTPWISSLRDKSSYRRLGFDMQVHKLCCLCMEIYYLNVYPKAPRPSTRGPFQYKYGFTCMGISIIKIMEILILVRRHLYIATGPSYLLNESFLTDKRIMDCKHIILPVKALFAQYLVQVPHFRCEPRLEGQ